MKLTQNFLLLPPEQISVEAILAEAGKTDDEIAKTIATTGVTKLRQSEKMLTQFAFDGVAAIRSAHAAVFEETDAIVVVSQSYDERIPSISTRLANMLGLDSSVFCLDVMDGCSGLIKAISIAQMLEARGAKRTLIVAGDLNSHLTHSADPSTRILFGDGLSVSIFESSDDECKTRLFNDGDMDGVISCSTKDNVMHMNGFEVFRFTRNVVPPLIKSFLEDQQTSLNDFDLLGLHQASDLVVSSLSSALKINNTLAEDFACGEIGNLGAGSIGAWLACIPDLPALGKKSLLAVGFGSGLSWGLASVALQLERNEVVYV